MGIDPDRLDGPIVGVGSTWTGTMPCNLNQRVLADRVVEAVNAAGGVGMAFNTIAVSDNQSQGTPGMRASLISREAIADSIELMAHAHDFEAFVCLVGCDKTTPASRWTRCARASPWGGSAGPTRSPRRSSSSPRTLPRS
jgi:dihydroxy-acid dehydratase